MDMTVFIFTVIAMQVLGLLVAKWASRGSKNHKDYFLASQSVTFFPLMMTLIATQVGGGLILGSTDEAYLNGWSTLMYPAGIAVGLFLLGVVCGTRIIKHGVSTLAQIFEVFYGSVALKKAASFLSIISLFMVLIAQILASHKMMLAFGISNYALFILIWGVIIFYTTMGGLKAVIATDILQAGFFFVTFVVCFIYALMMSDVSLYSNIPVPDSEIWSLETLSSYLLMPLIFMIIGQDMGQRCFSAKSAKTLRYSAITASLMVCVLGVIPISFGMWAKSMGITVSENTSVLMKSVLALTNPQLAAILAASIIAAIISTADSLISAISSNLSQDFFPNWGAQLGATKALSGAIAIGALLFSFFASSIVGVLIQSYELSVCCLTVPIIVSLFSSRKGHSLSAGLAMGLGVVGFIFTRIYAVPIPREIFSLLLSATGFGVGELFYARGLLQRVQA